MSFPLGDWILDHEDGVDHDLAQSGMKGQLRASAGCLRTLRAGDPAELRRRLGDLHGVDARRIVLTPGASTANTLVELYLFRKVRRERGRTPRAGVSVPEYPPLWDGPKDHGYRVQVGFRGCDVAILSNPNNPVGSHRSDEEVLRSTGKAHRLVDETFREFTSRPSVARTGAPRTWVTGTFTKVYGADAIRAGFALAPEEDARAFADLAELWVNRLSLFSVGGALALLDRRDLVLREARGLFERNLRALRERVPGSPRLSAPLWFDRGPAGLDTEDLAQRALAKGVLVCPGRFFRDPSGVRVCLTSRTFPRDLGAYLRVRNEGRGSSRGPPR